MAETILITGGAGFIGSHAVDMLLARGKRILVLDSLDPQVHGAERPRPAYLSAEAELIVGDVRDPAIVEAAVARADVVLHLAAAVGVAQSMYEIERFVDVNARGTAVLLEAITRHRARVRKLVLASSMSIYGEGRCVCSSCGAFDPGLRSAEQLARRAWEIHCPTCATPSRPAPTPESARARPTTVYAVTKRDQEELALTVGAAYRLPVVALRLFNVYGPRQALSNPYTGIGAIFSARLLAGRQPLVFEDGLQTRDFTHVADVAAAFAAVTDDPRADGGAYTVGSGRAHTLLELGELLARHIGVEWRPELSGSFREGDIRHCSADGQALERAIGLRPRVELSAGVPELVAWVQTQTATDQGDLALAALTERGLVR